MKVEKSGHSVKVDQSLQTMACSTDSLEVNHKNLFRVGGKHETWYKDAEKVKLIRSHAKIYRVFQISIPESVPCVNCNYSRNTYPE